MDVLFQLTKPYLASCLIVLFASAGWGQLARTATFRDGAPSPFGGGIYDGVEDVMLVRNSFGGVSAMDNFGIRQNFEIGNRDVGVPVLPGTPSAFSRHGLVRFEVSSLAGRFSKIESATLRLFVTDNDSQGSSDIEGAGVLQLYQLAEANAGWVEGTDFGGPLGQDPDVGESTWAQRLQSREDWAGSPGASTPGVDYLTSLVASRAFDAADEASLEGQAFDLAFNDPSIVEGWFGSNAGLFLRVENENRNAIAFHSSEATDINVRPQLIVQFTAIPEPGVLLPLLGLAGVGVVRRRR